MKILLRKTWISLLAIFLLQPQGYFFVHAEESVDDTNEQTEEITEETIQQEELEEVIVDENIEDTKEEIVVEEIIEPIVEEESEPVVVEKKLFTTKNTLRTTPALNGLVNEGENTYLYIGGVKKSGWQEVDGAMYYFDPSDFSMKTDWLKLNNQWYYLGNDGKRVTGWKKISDEWYFLDETTGVMKTGWLIHNNKKYYLRDSGKMVVGWKKIDNKWYFFSGSGAMKTGWLTDDNKRYYLRPTKGTSSDGTMVTGKYTIDNLNYYFASSGEIKHSHKIGLTYYAIDPNSHELLYTKKLMGEGIDVSAHNWYNYLSGKLKFENYKDKYIIIRLGYSETMDIRAEAYVDKCESLGIPYGFYIYSYALSVKDAEDEAVAALKNINKLKAKHGGTLKNFTMGMWFDMEDADGWKARNWTGNGGFQKASIISPIVDEFCSTIIANGIYCGVYLSDSWNIYLDSSCNSYDRWIAHWGLQNSYPNNMTNDVSKNAVMHQYTSAESLDKNVIYVDKSRFKNSGKITGSLSGKWKSDATGWRYMRPNGRFCKNQWRIINGKKYHFGSNGYMATGWKKIDGKWYHFKESGALEYGWLTVDNKKYFLDANGVMVTGLREISDETYFFEDSGEMAIGWKKIDGTWYYFDQDGAMQTGWLVRGSKKYYLEQDGKMVTGWKKLSKKWYYFRDSGAMHTGWKKINNKWYYMDEKGIMQANKWIGDYYVEGDGAMAVDKWIGKYHVNASGKWDKTK